MLPGADRTKNACRLAEPSSGGLIGALEELRSCLKGLADSGAFEAAAADGALAAELAALLGASLPQRLATLLEQAGGGAAAGVPASVACALILAQFAGLCFAGACCKLPQRSRWAAEAPGLACGIWATCDLVVAAGMTGLYARAAGARICRSASSSQCVCGCCGKPSVFHRCCALVAVGSTGPGGSSHMVSHTCRCRRGAGEERHAYPAP